MSKHIKSVILVALCLFITTANAKGLFDSFLSSKAPFEGAEQALLDRDYDKANKAFDNSKQLENILAARKYSIEFLKLVDETNQYIEGCKNYDCKQVDLNMFNTVYGSFQMQGGFSKDFTKKVYNEYISTMKKANNLNKLIVQTYNPPLSG